MKKLVFSTEYKQEFADFLHSYNGISLKKCARFSEGQTEIRQPSIYRIIMFENVTVFATRTVPCSMFKVPLLVSCLVYLNLTCKNDGKREREYSEL
jgi:hypothetical protein